MFLKFLNSKDKQKVILFKFKLNVNKKNKYLLINYLRIQRLIEKTMYFQKFHRI